MRILVIVALCVALGAESTSATAEGAKDCAAIADDAKRLICYDLIFKVKQTSSTSSKWDVSEETSKIDDRKNVFVAVESVERIQGRFGQKERARLIFVCREGKTASYITFGGHFMASLSGGTVTYRIDKRSAGKRHMTESTDHQALGHWSAAEAISFAKELHGATSLYIQATPHSESPISAEFPVDGLEEALKPLQAACKWPAPGPPAARAPAAKAPLPLAPKSATR
jgi:type VI secretion system protein VasI